MKAFFLYIVFFFFAVQYLGAQDSVSHETWLQKSKRRHAEKEQTGAFMITPLVGPAYTPELGFTIAGGILTSWRTDKSDTNLQRTSLPFNVGYGTNGAFFINSKMVSFWNHDKIRIYMDVNFKNMNDNYFGIGYENGRETPKGDSTTKYKRTWMQINPRFMWQFKKNFFAGAGFDLNYTKGSDACEVVANDPNYTLYNPYPFNSGINLIFQYDSRDIAVNAYRGMFVELNTALYGSYLGGQNNYQVYDVDIRKYIQMGAKAGHTLALEAKGRFATNDVPYGEMSQLGTPFDLRGYLWGQYRDKSMIFGIAEYRHKFYKQNGKPSMHGATAWIAAGSVANSPGQMQHWLPNGGIGYRLEVQPRMNLRLDYGIGLDGSSGFYFNFTEAF